MIRFSVIDSAAWAPGLETPGAWRAWAQQPRLPEGDAIPALTEVPAMQRRRIEPLGRAAIQSAFGCRAEPETPLVFVSRHGDVARSLGLLETLARGEAMSPTGFSLSVHNAIPALHSILRGDRGNYLAIAAGDASMEAACIEAAALLADGAPRVRVLACDAPLPAAYAPFVDGPETLHACCWTLAPAGHPEGTALALGWQADTSEGGAEAGELPPALAVHRFLLSDDALLERHVDARRWQWRRDG